jgi:hypothetical protein
LNKRIVRYSRVFPDIFDQLVLGNKPLAPFQQIDENLKSLSPQMLFLFAAFERTMRKINFNIFKTINLLLRRIHKTLNFQTIKFQGNLILSLVSSAARLTKDLVSITAFNGDCNA